MDLSTMLIAVISVVICSVPFIMARNNRIKRERNLLSEIKDHSQNKSIQFDKHETLSNFIIGVDDKANMLCFLRKNEKSDFYLEVDLKKYPSCEMDQINHQEGENNDVQTVIDQLFLKFKPSSPSDKVIQLELFNRKESYSLTGEIQLAQEWIQYLNNRIN